MVKKIIRKIRFQKKLNNYMKLTPLGDLLKKNKKGYKKRKNIKQLKINFVKINFVKINFVKLQIALYMIIIIIILVVIILLFSSSIFKIKNVNIIRKDNITNINIAYKSIENIRGKSIFLIDKKQIKENLENYQKNIKDIKVEVILPNTIKILIGSYKQLFNVKLSNKEYIILDNGTFVPFKNSKELKNIKIIGNIKNNGIIDYKQLLNGEYLKNMENIIEKLEKNIIGIKIKELNYYIVEREIHITLENGSILIFDLTENIDEQIKKISIFNKENLDIKKEKLVYIDIRIKDKIFYCSIEDKIICENNLKRIYQN